jgi:hypothetical protein
MSLHTVATLPIGASSANFSMRLPREDGTVIRYTKLLGKPESLVAKYRGKLFKYGVRASLTFADNFHNFSLKDVFAKGKTFEDVHNRVRDHLDKYMAPKFEALVEELPNLYLDTTSPTEPVFVLSLPPHTGIYTGYDMFFQGLGFDPATMQEFEATFNKARKTAKPASVTKAYGMVNQTDRHFIVQSEVLQSHLQPHNLAGGVGPKEVQIQVFVDNAEELYYYGLDEYLPGKRSMMISFMREMELIIEKMRVGMRNPQTTLELMVLSKEQASIVSKPFVLTNNDAVIKFMFDDETAAALKEVQRRLITFSMSRPSVFTLDLGRVSEMDPLDGLYPIKMFCRGMGPSNCWVSGLGYMSKLGDVRDGLPPISEGVIFESDNANLRIEFFDATMSPLRLDEEIDLYLMMRFSSL